LPKEKDNDATEKKKHQAMKYELLERLRQTAKPIVLSGAGTVGEIVFQKLQRWEIAAVCDGNLNLARTNFHSNDIVLLNSPNVSSSQTERRNST
jgi:ATP-dependent Clp protease ATP-binding subunit ClpA